MNWSDCLTIIFVILALLGAYAFGEDHGKKITEHKYERYLGGLDDRN
jgi:hypothetical protein